LRERIVYGDAVDAAISREKAIAANLLGKIYKHYDEAGLLSVERCDFKGNVLEKTRQVIADATIVAAFNPPPPSWQVQAFRVDWQPPAGKTLSRHAGALLDATSYATSASYDALNRVKLIRYPQAVNGQRKTLRPHYNRAGGLQSVELDGATFVEHLAYNAKGQRVLIAYGNGVMTRYAYDAVTFRLARLRSERYTKPAPFTYSPTGAPLQDFAYKYDLAGNITAIAERTPGSGIANTPSGIDALDRSFGYDPLYRLLSATGREHDNPPSEPWDERPRGTDITRVRAYTEQYQYDKAGNLSQLHHLSHNSGFVRQLALIPGNNRLKTLTVGDNVFDYTYDANGNLIREATSRHFEWDYADRMRVFRTQADEAEPSVHAQYLYNVAGERVKKLVRKQGGQIETTIYIDGIFEHQRIVQGGVTQENNTLHVMDDQSRLALVRIGSPLPGDTTPAVKFHLGDHLGSSHLAIDGNGGFINREEYTPYGETSFGSFARKRYRFTGKERDEESGLNYHIARYYVPWLARWMSCDPKGVVAGANTYHYVAQNPVFFVDPDGHDLVAHRESTNEILSASEMGGESKETSGDASAIESALMPLITAGNIGTKTVGNQVHFFSTGSAASRATISSALSAAGFAKADDMAAALLDNHNISTYSSRVTERVFSSWSMVSEHVETDKLDRLKERSLTNYERGEAKRVFGSSLDLDAITLIEGGSMSKDRGNWWIKGEITRALPSSIHFPTGRFSRPYFMELLIHELTHSWQYQHGYSIPQLGLWALYGDYDYGGVGGLITAKAFGKSLDSFNPEEQADIISDYYRQLTTPGGNTAPFDPFVRELQAVPPYKVLHEPKGGFKNK
jgi:RHS repeat-associated protein